MTEKLDLCQRLTISARYWLLGMAESDSEYFKVLEAMELGMSHHDGYRNGGDPEFIHQLEIFHYLRTMHKHIRNPKMVYMLVFLHDSLEDPNQASKKAGKPVYITPAEIESQFGAEFLGKLKIMSKEILGIANPNFSLDAVFDDVDTSIAKGGDRVHNVRTMVGVFKPERLKRYVLETAEEFFPRVKRARRKFADQEAIYENVKLTLLSHLQLIAHITSLEDELQPTRSAV